MPDTLREIVARAMAHGNGDDLSAIPAYKSDWYRAQGMFQGRFRDINEPMRGDYYEMADAVLRAIEEAGYLVLSPEQQHLVGRAMLNVARRPKESGDG